MDKATFKFINIYHKLFTINFKLNWRRIVKSENGPTARTFHRALVVDNIMYIFGGISMKNVYFVKDLMDNDWMIFTEYALT